MLEGKSLEKLDNSNKLLATQPEYSTLNVFGAGYGMESYVYGNTDIRVAEGMSSNVSANFIYGGGQQGNVIGVTNVEIFNVNISRLRAKLAPLKLDQAIRTERGVGYRLVTADE